MKILFYAWDIYDEDLTELQISPNGGSIAIKNIIEYIGRKQDAYLFIGKKKMPAKRLHHINIVDTQKYPNDDDALDNNEFWLITMEKAFEQAIVEIKPDFINLHGGGELIKRCILICKKLNRKYAYTNHLYIGEEKKYVANERAISWEKEIFSIPEIKLTVVGTTAKARVLKDYPKIKQADVEVILNGTDFRYEVQESDLVQRLNLKNKKVLLCIGSIQVRKNQIQLVRAFAQMKSEDRENIVVLFCGKDMMNGALQQEIEKYGLQENLKCLGVLPNTEMAKYYAIADGYILISLAEGLSLTMLEAIVYGLPLIMFDDVEGASDLADKKVSLFIHGKENRDVAEAICKWKNTEWDKEYIQEYAKYFNMERVADDYIAYYKKRLQEK